MKDGRSRWKPVTTIAGTACPISFDGILPVRVQQLHQGVTGQVRHRALGHQIDRVAYVRRLPLIPSEKAFEFKIGRAAKRQSF